MRHVPRRSCIGCRAVRERPDLIRLAATPAGEFCVDPRGRLPGRGAYLCPDRKCLQVALKRKALDRAFRCAVSAEAAAALLKQIENYLLDQQARAAPGGAMAVSPGAAASEAASKTESGGG